MSKKIDLCVSAFQISIYMLFKPINKGFFFSKVLLVTLSWIIREAQR
jgi:hypothetical protein